MCSRRCRCRRRDGPCRIAGRNRRRLRDRVGCSRREQQSPHSDAAPGAPRSFRCPTEPGLSGLAPLPARTLGTYGVGALGKQARNVGPCRANANQPAALSTIRQTERSDATGDATLAACMPAPAQDACIVRRPIGLRAACGTRWTARARRPPHASPPRAIALAGAHHPTDPVAHIPHTGAFLVVCAGGASMLPGPLHASPRCRRAAPRSCASFRTQWPSPWVPPPRQT